MARVWIVPTAVPLNSYPHRLVPYRHPRYFFADSEAYGAIKDPGAREAVLLCAKILATIHDFGEVTELAPLPPPESATESEAAPFVA